LLIQIIAVTILLVSFRFAREARVVYHRAFVIAGAVLVAVGFFAVMLESFLSVYSFLVADPFLPANFAIIMHVVVGVVASIIAIYLAFRMLLIPPADVGVSRQIMRVMLVMWLVAVGLGIAIYGILYTPLLP
jgi:uncharacterized membrane protein YozB (DUF420 family)